MRSHDKAISLRSDLPEAYSNRGNALLGLKQYEAALESFDKAIFLNPDFAGAYNNRGNAFLALARYESALQNFNKAISLKPDLAEAYNNRGNVLGQMKKSEAAVQSFNEAISLKADLVEAYNNRGYAFLELKQYEAAARSFGEAISFKPSFEFLFGILIHAKMHMCDWPDFDSEMRHLSEQTNLGESISPPFSIVGLIDSPLLQRKSAEIWTDIRHPLSNDMPALGKLPVHEKIRVGYFSADFHDHATMYLMAEMLERHDREKFELIAFSFGPDSDDEMRGRAIKACDRFIDVRNQSDHDVALLARAMEVDIAVDLKGPTQGSRTGIFSFRAAPVQVSFLGFPGTMGAEYIDYLIADRVVVPDENKPYFVEKIAYLPYSYQVNDSARLISDRIFSRTELGLPSEGFVFCCFNNNYKITPVIFDSWMRILKTVEGSVLWLFEGNQKAKENLYKEAAARGVDPERVIFAQQMPLSDHLARHRLADLFIDTLPYNAHTTASDALWAGLPVLTCSGDSFASRVAASLLNAIELPDLITTTLPEYEERAIDLAINPEKLEAIKRKLAANRLTTPLFNARLFARHIEAAYGEMYERYRNDLPPDHIRVASHPGEA